MSSLNRSLVSAGFGNWRKLPMLRQTEKAECGLACLAMVGWFWGLRIDVSTLRQRFVISSRGMNLASMVKIADALGMSSRAVRVDTADLTNLKLPAILHWEFRHFVVLKEVGRRYVIHDPNVGVRRVTLQEINSKFTGVALELWPAPQFRAEERIRTTSWRLLLGQPVGFMALFVKLLFIGLGVESITLLLPVITQWGIDNVAPTGDMDLLTILTLCLGAMTLMQTILVMARGYSISSATQLFMLDWKINIFAHMLKLPVSFFLMRRVGDITSRYESVETIVGTLNDGFVEGILDSVTGVITVFMLFMYSALLSIVTVIGAAIYVIVRLIRYGRIRELTILSLSADSKENSSLIETIRGIRPIKLFAREKGREQEWVASAVDEANATLELNRSQVSFKALSNFIGGIEQALVFYLSLRAVTSGQMTVGMLFAFTAYRGQFYSSVASLVDNYISIQTVKIHAERVADIVLSAPEEEQASEHVERIGSLAGTLTVDNVSFAYGEFEDFALQNVALHFGEGENVAIVGKSGCGKSTLLALLVGLSAPTEGRILFGGLAIKSLGLRVLRRQISIVMQDDVLFLGSIAQNIAAFEPAIDTEKVIACANMACIGDDIEAMPMGYNTLVTDLGGSLSGGQRQRLCIARALYREPKILIMDEATSHLDIETEKVVNERIRRLGITRIIVAHRLDTIRYADRLILFDKGRVVADTSLGANYEDIIGVVSGEKSIGKSF